MASSNTKKGAVLAAATLAVAAAFITPWEGVRTSAYRDPVGIWTVCIGETEGVKPGASEDAATIDALREKASNTPANKAPGLPQDSAQRVGDIK